MANISDVLSMRFRMTSKGANQGPSELHLLGDIQKSGVFEISVHVPEKAGASYGIHIHKFVFDGQNSQVRLRFAERLGGYGVIR